jgi:hypothetical protein
MSSSPRKRGPLWPTRLRPAAIETLRPASLPPGPPSMALFWPSMALRPASMPLGGASSGLRPAALPLQPPALPRFGACMALRAATSALRPATPALRGARVPLHRRNDGAFLAIAAPSTGNAGPARGSVGPPTGNVAPKRGNAALRAATHDEAGGPPCPAAAGGVRPASPSRAQERLRPGGGHAAVSRSGWRRLSSS